MLHQNLITSIFGTLLAAWVYAEPGVQVERLVGKAATPDFRFTQVPSLSDDDAAQDGSLEVIDGKAEYGRDPQVLIDGGGPAHSYDSRRTFGFAQGTPGGRIRIDLGSVMPIAQVNSYSWHEGDRAPQLYTLYASDGTSEKFVPTPLRGIDPAQAGWVKIITVDTRPKGYPRPDNGGGQYGVSITDSTGNLGSFRYLLWDMTPNLQANHAAQCEYAELDVVVTGHRSHMRQGEVHLRDGKQIAGPARLEEDRLILSNETGSELKVTLDEILSASFEPMHGEPPGIAGESAQTTGLRGEYFAGQDLSQLKIIRFDPVLSFNWTNAGPDTLIGQQYSIRWTGQLRTVAQGHHGFSIMFGGGVRLFVDGNLLIDQWNDLNQYRHEGNAQLEAGRMYDLKIECRGSVSAQHGERGRVRFFWSYQGAGRQPVPSERLFPPPDRAEEARRIRVTQPSVDNWLIAPRAVRLEAKILGALPGGANVEFMNGWQVIGTATRVGISAGSLPSGSLTPGGSLWSFEWQSPPAGEHAITARMLDARGVALSSPAAPLTIASSGDGTLPEPWGLSAIGSQPSAKPISAASYANQAFTISCTGGQIHSQADGCAFVCQTLDGDGQITCRVNPFAKDRFGFAGVMFRESLAADSPAFALLSNVDLARVVIRNERGGYVNVNPLQSTLPTYLRITRRDRTFAAYTSDDGVHWNKAYSRDALSLPRRLFAGVAVAGNPDDPALVAVLDHVSVIPAGEQRNATPGVLTGQGVFLAGEVRKCNQQQLFLARLRGGELLIPVSDVARIVFQPLPPELAHLENGHTGVLLSDGDFFDGEFKEASDGRLTVESVLFGRKSYNLGDRNLLAAVFRDPQPSEADEVHTRDGSIYLAKSMRVEAGRLILDDESIGSISLSLRNIVSIKRHRP